MLASVLRYCHDNELNYSMIDSDRNLNNKVPPYIGTYLYHAHKPPQEHNIGLWKI